MWHLLAQVDGAQTMLRAHSWQRLRDRIIELGRDPTLTQLALDATPDKFWCCTSNSFLFKLREIREHEPILGDTVANDIDHSQRAHAQLGASSTYRWWACPGSINLINSIGAEEEPSFYAREGTAAHELSHMCLLNGQDAIEYIDREIDGFLVDDEMATAVQVYLDKCREYSNNQAWECFTEKRFSLRDLNPPGPMFGTADFVAVNKATGQVVVIDLKYGKGIVVEAIGNPQLKYYAFGVLLTMPGIHIKSVEAFIVQPRGTGNSVKSVTYRPAELYAWSLDLLEHAKATMAPDAPLVPGSHCRFCGATGRCTAQAEAAFQSAELEFDADILQGEVIPPEKLPQVRILTTEQLGMIRHKFGVLRDFMNAVDETLKDAIEQGATNTGWKLVQDEGHRKWRDESTTPDQLTSLLGLEQKQVYETKLISPATAEKLAVSQLRKATGMKAKDAEVMVKGMLGKITVRPLTKPKLVPDGHQLPGLPARGAEFDYEQLPGSVTQ